jgi:hypothetical protein
MAEDIVSQIIQRIQDQVAQIGEPPAQAWSAPTLSDIASIVGTAANYAQLLD